jgi:hypothetical protein
MRGADEPRLRPDGAHRTSAWGPEFKSQRRPIKTAIYQLCEDAETLEYSSG